MRGPAADPSRAALFHKQSDVHKATAPDPYTIFLRWCSARTCAQHDVPAIYPQANCSCNYPRQQPVLAGRLLKLPGCAGGRLLQRTDWFTQEKAALLLTAIVAARPNRCPPEGLSSQPACSAWT